MDLKKKKAKNDRQTNILVILPLDRDKAALKHFKMNAKEDVRIHFLDDAHYEHHVTCTDFNVVAYVKHAIAYVKKYNIKGVIYSHDLAALIAAAVCEKTDLPGPSVESIFQACHLSEDLMRWSDMFPDFFAAYLPNDQYSIEPMMVEDSRSIIEGWVDSHGVVHIWALSDVNYHQNTLKAQNCYSMPSVISPAMQAQMVALTTQTIKKYGLNNGFFSVGIAYDHTAQTCKVVEVHPCAASLYYLMHKQCFNANLYKAMILLSLARDHECYQESPVTNESKHLYKKVGALFFIVTFGQGKAAQLFDFEKAQQMMVQDDIHGMEIFVHPDADIADHSTAGFRLAEFYAFGSSYESIHALADHWRGEVIKNIANSPYHVNVSYH